MDELKQLEKFIGYELPISLKTLLYEAAYTSLLSLKMLTDENVRKLENYINANYDSIRPNKFADYKNMRLFSFLPGHREILLSLPIIINNLKDESQCETKWDDCSDQYSTIFKLMTDVVKNNKGKSKNARQYNDGVKDFATYIFLLCGRTCYDTLSKNLPIPSTRTILRCITENKKRIVEGKLRCEELLHYLTERKAGFDVWLSEDASGIIAKIQYDPSSNQLIGLVLPINNSTGCPERYKSTARDVEEIQKFMKHNKSTLVYIVMATPLKEGIPPFLLQMYGTNNTFSTEDVVRRWNHTTEELRKFGIKVRGISADGDLRLLSAMRHRMKLMPNFLSIQDPTHDGTKNRNRVLRPSGLMPMGTKQVSASHLKILIAEVPKEVHGLTYSDISPTDRQNFNSLKKCMSLRVRNSLLKYVPDSEATAFYFQLCHEITSSFMECDLLPLQRVQLIYHAVYFFRIWRKWVLSSKYCLRYNFITSNAYMCTELNAENLIRIIRQFRDEGKPELFLPQIFSSQPCENAFRQFRAMGTVNFTKINFTLLELLHMIGRLEVQNDLLYTKLPSLGIQLPKLESKEASLRSKVYALPADEDIERCLERAKRSAINDASNFGIHVDPIEIETSVIPVARLNSKIEMSDDSDDEYEPEHDFLREEDDQNLSRYPEDEEILDGDKESAYAIMTDHTGQQKSIRKSTIVWLMSEGTQKISNDRLTRVQQSKKNTKHMEASSLNTHLNPELKVFASKCIKIGDWCFFKYTETWNPKFDDNEKICLGLVLAFKFTHGKSEKEKTYKGNIVDLDDIDTHRDLEVLSSWYQINDNARFIPINQENHRFLNLENYIATLLVKPMVDPDTKTLHFDEKDFKQIDEEVLKLI